MAKYNLLPWFLRNRTLWKRSFTGLDAFFVSVVLPNESCLALEPVNPSLEQICSSWEVPRTSGKHPLCHTPAVRCSTSPSWGYFSFSVTDLELYVVYISNIVFSHTLIVKLSIFSNCIISLKSRWQVTIVATTKNIHLWTRSQIVVRECFSYLCLNKLISTYLLYWTSA